MYLCIKKKIVHIPINQKGIAITEGCVRVILCKVQGGPKLKWISLAQNVKSFYNNNAKTS